MLFTYLSKTLSLAFGCVAFAAIIMSVEAANATIYYVATTGSDSNPGTSAQPLRTIKKGVSSVSAGDTLYVKTGTYYESIDTWAVPFAKGTSWSNPITVAVNPGDTVTIKPLADKPFFWIAGGQRRYLIIKGFIVDGRNTAHYGFKFESGAQYIRIIDCEIKNAKKSGILVTGSNDSYHEFIHLNIHNNGNTGNDHGMYITTGRNVVERSVIHNNSSFGIHLFNGDSSVKSANYNIIRSNTLRDNGTFGNWSCGLLLSSGTGNLAYNNTAYGNFSGLCARWRATNSRLYNNLSYGNDNHGIYVDQNSNTGSRIENNTLYQNGSYGVFVGNEATTVTVKNNIAWNNPTNLRVHTTTNSHNLTTNPSFANASSKDFHLQQGSSAIDSGKTISGITTDLDGKSRPHGTAFDIGAYEYQGTSTTSGTTSSTTSGTTSSTTSSTFPPPMATPSPGTTLTSTSVTFTGGHTSQDTAHWLLVGTSKGGSNLHSSGSMTGHSRTVSGLPTSGTLYVRWYSSKGSGWQYHDHTYTMNAGSTSGSTGGSTSGSTGGSTGGSCSGSGTFPAPMASPCPGATLTSTSVTFTGGHTSQDTAHWLLVGRSPGGSSLHSSGSMTGHSRTVSGLPTSGTLYVRWYSSKGSGWQYHDHTYTMNAGSSTSTSGSTSTTSSTFPAPMATPNPGTTLTSTSVTFTGGHTSQDTAHWLLVGRSPGGSSLHSSGSMTGHSRTVSGLPTSGTLYVRWYSSKGSGWQYHDHTYTMNAGGN